MPKFLILRFSSIGDIVLTSPLVRCLKSQVPDAEIHFATKKAYRKIVENNPNIDKVYVLEDSIRELSDQLKLENYDFVIDLHRNLRTSLIKFRLGKPAFTFNKLNFQKWLLVTFKKNLLPNSHIVDRYLETVSSFGVVNDQKGLDFFIPEKDNIPNDWLPESHRNGYVAFAIGGQHFTKRLPVAKMIELCNSLSLPIVLIGGREDVENADLVVEGFKKSNKFPENIISACGKCNLGQSASLIQNAQKVYTHDTGMMHIAAAFKRNIVAIWGNTVPEFGMYPYLTEFTIKEVKDLHCRPCSKIGHKKCPLGHFKCMNELEFDKK